MNGRIFWRRMISVSILACGPIVGMAAAVEVKFFRQQSMESFLQGTLEGVGVDATGRLQLGDEVERLVDIEEPFLFAAAEHPEGWVVGTGNSGKVLLLSRSGELSALFSASEPEIFALWVDDDGTVFAGSSPGGKVYRWADGELTEFFDPGETYIWALARHADGRLLVATGTEGRLYSVDAGGQGEILYDSEDVHMRTMKLLDDGRVLLGTAGEGLVLSLGVDGSIRTLYDAPHPEVVAFAAAPDGVCYAAVLASEASVVDLAESQKRSGEPTGEAQMENSEGGEGGGDVLMFEGSGGDGGTSRPAAFSGSRTEILRISPGGAVETIWSFDDETAYALLWHRDRLWVATGLEGKLYSFRDRKMVLETGVDERQIVALLPGAPGPVFATTNAAAFYVVADRTRRRGTYTSPSLDAGQLARFGTLRWKGETPDGAAVRFSVRSGMSAEPDRTWSSWSKTRSGAEIAITGTPIGRYVQWRADFEAGREQSPRITTVDLSYRQENLAPRIQRVEVLDAGQILVPSNFNAAQQIYEPTHPNREGIFTTLKPTVAEDRRLKQLWRSGYRTLRWEAEDPNDDPLRYVLAFRPEGSEQEWLEIAAELDDDYYSFDATVLPDGIYRFRVTASDRQGNTLEDSLTTERTSAPVIVDHRPPALAAVRRDGDRLLIEVRDAWSPLRSAEVSVDAGPWKPARPSDGLLDSTSENLEVEISEGSRLVLLKVMDAAFNGVTYDIGGSD